MFDEKLTEGGFSMSKLMVSWLSCDEVREFVPIVANGCKSPGDCLLLLGASIECGRKMFRLRPQNRIVRSALWKFWPSWYSSRGHHRLPSLFSDRLSGWGAVSLWLVVDIYLRPILL